MKQAISLTMAIITLVAVGWMRGLEAEEKQEKTAAIPASSIQAKDFSNLLGMSGFSNMLLNNHFKLYQGYVKNTNLLFERLKSLLIEKKDRTAEYAELKRRLGWEFNGVLLHEYYFENLGGREALGVNTALYKKIVESFGSFDAWKQDFISTSMMRGIGWVVLYREPRTGKVVNAWIGEHDVGHIAAAGPLLVIDVFEHAYLPDYQLDREKYVEAFFANINWKVAAKRFDKLGLSTSILNEIKAPEAGGDILID
jgi:Fe-Mn family superoxide dismutase